MNKLTFFISIIIGITFLTSNLKAEDTTKETILSDESTQALIKAFKSLSDSFAQMAEEDKKRNAQLEESLKNKKIRLLSWNKHDLKSAEEIITIVIRATALVKGGWWQSYGLLGTSRIPDSPKELFQAKEGYKSLFLDALDEENNKIKLATDRNLSRGEPSEKSSWIYKREYYIGRLGYGLKSCVESFISNPDKVENGENLTCFQLFDTQKKAYKYYKILASKGFYDFQLGNTIGLSFVLNFAIQKDKQYYIDLFKDWQNNNSYDLPMGFDAYQNTITQTVSCAENKGEFFTCLKTEMDNNDFYPYDSIAFPYNKESISALTKLIKEDFVELNKHYAPLKEKSFFDELKEKYDATMKIWSK